MSISKMLCVLLLINLEPLRQSSADLKIEKDTFSLIVSAFSLIISAYCSLILIPTLGCKILKKYNHFIFRDIPLNS